MFYCYSLGGEIVNIIYNETRSRPTEKCRRRRRRRRRQKEYYVTYTIQRARWLNTISTGKKQNGLHFWLHARTILRADFYAPNCITYSISLF